MPQDLIRPRVLYSRCDTRLSGSRRLPNIRASVGQVWTQAGVNFTVFHFSAFILRDILGFYDPLHAERAFFHHPSSRTVTSGLSCQLRGSGRV